MAVVRRYLVLLLLGLCAGEALSGTISGRVVSAGEGRGEPLIGAIVLVQGTVRGTVTNLKGEFSISGLTAGTYTVVVTMVGYVRETRTGVIVDETQPAVLEVGLFPSPVQMDQIVVTANKHSQSLEEVPVSISILDAAAVRMRNSLTIEEALRYIPGVNLTGFQVNIRGSSGYSRGAGSRVLMLLDGIPFIAGDTGELNFESIPIGQVERIEVVKGASSALYGSNALGGVINIITREIPEVPDTRVRMYAGGYDRPHYSLWEWTPTNRYLNGQSVSHAFRSGDLGVGLFFSRQIDDGYRLNDYRRRYNVYARLKEEISPTSAFTATFGLLNQFGGQFLYWRDLANPLEPPEAQQNDNIRSNRFFISGQYNSVLSEGLLLTVRGLWYHNLWGFETRHGYGRAESQADDYRVDAVVTAVLSEEHTLTSGMEANMDEIRGDMFVPHTIGGFALYAQDEMSLASDLKLTAGLRFDFQEVGVTAPGGQLNPKLALNYIPWEGTSLRASFGRGFRVPSVAEAFISASISGIQTVPNTGLRPERSLSYELGLSQRLWGFAMFDIAGFRSDYDNLIEAGLYVEGPALMIQWRNVTKARVTGLETSLKVGAFDGDLQLGTGYTYVWPEDLTTNDILKYRPRHVFYTNLSGKLGWFRLGVDFRFISRVDRIDELLVKSTLIPNGIVVDGDQRVPIYVTDLRLGADFDLFGLPGSADLHVNNLFRYNYIELIGNMMPPRNYVLVLELRP
jgi:iron complex outermembrane receptor protein